MMKNLYHSNKTNIAGGVVINPKKGIAIVNQNNDSWSLPKGHVENNENTLEAAKREIYEETGLLKIKYIKKLGSYKRYRIGLDGQDDKSELKLIDMLLFITNEAKLKPIDKHNPEARWVSIDKAVDLLTHPKDILFFKEKIIFFKEYLN